ncbi:MAG: hypothetical protein ACR2IJ_09205 [Fluviibacter sp.]
MTQDEIISLAMESGLSGIGERNMIAIERFATLIAAHEREKQPEHFAKAIAELVECCKVLAEENEAAVLAEREACAKVCEELRDEDGYDACNMECAAAIRARGEK